MAADRTSHQLNHHQLAAIECPLHLRDQDPTSQPQPAEPASRYAGLMHRLGGPSRLSSLLSTKDPNRPVELTLITDQSNHFVRPIAGEFVNTSNILVKVIKRTRKPSSSSSSSNPNNPHTQSVTRQLYKIEPVGVIPLTVRFRSLADYHYTPDLKHPINILARDIRSLNFEGVLKFRFEQETEDYSSSSKIGLFPPPLFSRYLVPQLYNYRQSVPSVVTDTPEGQQRLVNKAKYVPLAPQAVSFDEPQVPQGPLPNVVAQRKTSDELVYQKIEALFEERPMWIRVAFQNQLCLRHVRLLRQNREILALSCYTFTDGPFKDFLIKFKYDPRVHPEARLFQRISLRNLDKTDASEKFTFKLMKRPVNRGASSAEFDPSTRRDHIFDGQELHQSVGTYQLCDITDALLTSLINSTKGVLPKCHVRTGWYTSNAIEQIRSILRKKFHGLLSGQRVIKDIECVDLLDIDISQEAVDLVKKSSVTEKRGLNKFYNPDHNQLDLDPLQIVPSRPSSPTKSSTLSKPLHPNPFLKYRRERNRIKAKPADKSVTFLNPIDLDEDVEMTENDADGTTKEKEDNMMVGSTSRSGRRGKTTDANEMREGEADEEEEDDMEAENSDEEEDDDDDDDDDDDEEQEEEEEEEEFEGNENGMDHELNLVDMNNIQSSELSDPPDL